MPLEEMRSRSFDELILRTITLVEPLPQQIRDIEDSIHKLDLRLNTYDLESSSLKNQVDEMKKKCNIFVEDLSTLNETISPVVEEYKSNQDSKNTIRTYIRDAVSSFIKYAMLPFTIVILIIVGIPTQYLPWYNKPTNTIDNKISSELYNYIKSSEENGTITYGFVMYIIQRYRDAIIVSRSNNETEFLSNLFISNRNLNNVCVVWLPMDRTKNGYIQYYFSRSTQGEKILIER